MAWDHLKWLIFVLIGLWFIWFFTGGPQKVNQNDLNKPFIRPAAPLDTGEVYGPK